MLPNRFDNYDSFRVPKNFRIIESNPYGRLILMHEALDEFLVTNREQNKWKTRMDSESVLARHIENSGSFGIIEGQSNQLTAREEYLIVAYKAEKNIFKEKLQRSLFDTSRGHSNLLIHGVLSKETSELLLKAMKEVLR